MMTPNTDNPNENLFRFCPKCASDDLKLSSIKSFQCSRCQFKFYINTAAAAIGLIFNPENELLVTTRKNDPYKGMLDLPGGFAEPNESIETCITREIREELNLDITDLAYLYSLPNILL